MKKTKVVICLLIALFFVSVTSSNTFAATCSYGCTSVYSRSCYGFDGSYNTVQHGYYDTTGKLVYHGYKLYMGDTIGRCVHGTALELVKYSHVHYVKGHTLSVCGVSDVTSCTYK